MGVKTGLSTAPFLFFLSPVFSPRFSSGAASVWQQKKKKKSLNVSPGVRCWEMGLSLQRHLIKNVPLTWISKLQSAQMNTFTSTVVIFYIRWKNIQTGQWRKMKTMDKQLVETNGVY